MFNDNGVDLDQPQIDIPLPVAKDENKRATQSNGCLKLNVEPRSGRRSRNVGNLHPAPGQSDSEEGRSRPSPREGGTRPTRLRPTAKSDDKSRISTHASSKSAPGATKPMTGLDAGIVAATDSTRNDASRIQMVQGGAVDDVKQSHEEASNMAQLDVGPNRRHVDGERTDRVLNPNAASFIPGARSKIHASVLNPNAESFIPGAKNSGVGASGSPTSQPALTLPALTLPSSTAHELGMAAPGLAWPMFAPRMQPLDHRDGMMAAPTAEGVHQYGAIPPNMQDAQHQMWQRQGAAARPQHQLQQQQMLGRRQCMEQRVARPGNSFEQQGQRETARNAFQGHIRGHEELVDGEEDEEDRCVICYDKMSGDNILEIECGHIFHTHCLHKWLEQKETCPICRSCTIYSALHK